MLFENTSKNFFQLHLARYINANDGLSQVRALLGKDLPSDLCDCDKFLTVTFSPDVRHGQFRGQEPLVLAHQSHPMR